MLDLNSTLAADICSARAASVVAAAGCGKTEQIVRATSAGAGRRLILTHTHAGVDALRNRLCERKVPRSSYYVDTIAGWCLRFTASYPKLSGLTVIDPRTEQQWSAVYAAAARLLFHRAIRRVLDASYCGLFVDEYQDCNGPQHAVVQAISETLPTCIFGDPLQAIFDFNGQEPIDWLSVVFPSFPLLVRLSTPHRWHKHGHSEMATWLEGVRTTLELGGELNFSNRPSSVNWVWLPEQPGPRQNVIVKTCREAMNAEGNLVVIADAVNEGGRAQIARALGKQRFSTIEAVDSKTLYAAAKRLATTDGVKKLQAILDMLERCMSGIARAEFEKAVASHRSGGRLGSTKFGEVIKFALALERSCATGTCLALIDAFSAMPGTHIFRREMLSAIRAALTLVDVNPAMTLTDALWQVQNKLRHAGRRVPYYAVGSTLLVKGQEFCNVVIIHSPGMSRKDWYVALTRATHGVTILSPQRRFTPPA
jgi:DNA helicase-2/ATP-dependent DNA helicase PcrA